MCPFYSKITHYTKLEKLGAQNIAVCENQGKQHISKDNWKLIKMFLLKKKRDDTRKTKRLTETQVLTKYFTSYQIRCKSLRKRKVMQLVKPIRYWEITTSMQSNEFDQICWIKLIW